MKPTDDEELYKIRHSLAHVLAQAVKQKYPQAKLGFGPPTEHGFYYDFDLGNNQIHEDDLKELQKIMKKIIRQKQPFKKNVYHNVDDAVARLKDLKEDYKIENVYNLKNKGVTEFSFFENGDFVDLCEGPHVEHTGVLPENAFKLDRVAGAYWLGDEKNKMLTRIYGLAFKTKEQLDDFMNRRKIAEQFDHRRLGKELAIYHQSDLVGKGLILWLPNGTVIRDEIENYAKEVEFRYGYKRVATPHITKADLYYKSQHLPAYQDSMYPPMITEDEGKQESYYLKPMNCPHHHLIYSAQIRSYKELPLRLAEYGTCYRYEQSGELSGLIRVRCMTLNDAHIYLAEEQFHEEMNSILQMYQELYSTFKLSHYRYRLSVRGKDNSKNKDKYKGDPEMWERAETALRQVLDNLNVEYDIGEDEASFYGPKIDVQFRNLMGREETVSTIQVDYLSPKNFNLKYIDKDGQEKQPVLIHRSPLSTHERFISYLIEYYGGAFPTWCAPTQVCIIPVNEQCLAYGQQIQATLFKDKIRVLLDDTHQSLNKKIRIHTQKKTPILLIIGHKEVDEGTVTIRRYKQKEQKTMNFTDFVAELKHEIKERTMHLEPMSTLL